MVKTKTFRTMKTPMQKILKEWRSPTTLEEFRLWFNENINTLVEEERQGYIEAYNQGAVNDQKRALQGGQYFKDTYNGKEA